MHEGAYIPINPLGRRVESPIVGLYAFSMKST
nr:MAG TPA: hypothetical protein [Caudoviricetes sp.]